MVAYQGKVVESIRAAESDGFLQSIFAAMVDEGIVGHGDKYIK